MTFKLHVRREIQPLFTCFGFSCLKLVKKRRKNNTKAICASNYDDVTSDSSRTHHPRPPSVWLSQFSLTWFCCLFFVFSLKMKASCTFYCHFYGVVKVARELFTTKQKSKNRPLECCVFLEAKELKFFFGHLRLLC